jgi:hypothetical protein
VSLGAVRAALETAALAITPAIDTVFETGEFTLASGAAYAGDYKPLAGRAYQRFYLLPAAPDDSEIGGPYVERGVFQITLRLPLGAGTKPASDRVALIVAAFHIGASFVSGGVTVLITKTPEPGPGSVEADRYQLPVSISYSAQH